MSSSCFPVLEHQVSRKHEQRSRTASLRPYCQWRPSEGINPCILPVPENIYVMSGGQGLICGSTFLRLPRKRNRSKLRHPLFLPNRNPWRSVSPKRTARSDIYREILLELHQLPAPKRIDRLVELKKPHTSLNKPTQHKQRHAP